MNKKLVVVILVGICVFVVCLIVYFINNNKEIAPKNSNNSAENYPSQSSLKKGQNDTDINQNFNNDPIPSEGDNLIRKSFEEFAAKEPSNGFEWAGFVEKGSSLDNFSSAIGIKVDPQLNDLLKKDQFYIFSCLRPYEDKKDIGIVVQLKILENYSGNLYEEEIAMIKNWENTIFQDMNKLLFPGVVFSSEQLEQKPVFKGGEFAAGQSRYADINLPNNEVGKIIYRIVEDYVIISTSKDCLDKASKQLYDTDN